MDSRATPFRERVINDATAEIIRLDEQYAKIEEEFARLTRELESIVKARHEPMTVLDALGADIPESPTARVVGVPFRPMDDEWRDDAEAEALAAAASGEDVTTDGPTCGACGTPLTVVDAAWDDPDRALCDDCASDPIAQPDAAEDAEVSRIEAEGTTDERESLRKDEPTPTRVSDGAVPAEPEHVTPEQPDDATRTEQIMDDEALAFAMDRTDAFTKLDLMKYMSVTRPTATAIISRLIGARKIRQRAPGLRSYVPVLDGEPSEPDAAPAPTAEPESEPEIRPVDEAALEAAGVEARSSRRGTRYFTEEMVRDAAREMREPFNSKTLAVFMSDKLNDDINPNSVGRYIRALHQKGTLERIGGQSGPHVRYVYRKPNGDTGPKERPRSDGPHGPKGGEHHRLKAVAGGRGVEVPHVRPINRAPKSSQNKRKQALGFKVKSQR